MLVEQTVGGGAAFGVGLRRLKTIRTWIAERFVHSLSGLLGMGRDERLSVYLEALRQLLEAEERFLLPSSFKESASAETDRYSYQRVYIDFDIKESERVLDIGSGGYPFPLATDLVDLYEHDTSHRPGERLVADGRRFHVANVEKLPFIDHEFDFVYCSHVLEHVADPAAACEEIMRTGRRGFIETPTRLSDIMLNFTRLKDHHKWHINMLGNTLVFMEWTDRERRDTECNDFFLMLQSKYENPFKELVRRHRDLFVNMLSWEGRFSYHVLDKAGRLQSNGGATGKQDRGK